MAETSEYRRQYSSLGFAEIGDHRPTSWRLTLPNTIDFQRPFNRAKTNYTQMSDWLKIPVRTAPFRSGAFKPRFPDPLNETDWRAIRSGKYRGEVPSEEDYRLCYQQLMKNTKFKYRDPGAGRHKSGGKGGWRHIQQSYGAGIDNIAWVDGAVSLRDSGVPVAGDPPSETTLPKIEGEFRGGKGPYRHFKETMGVRHNNEQWINGGVRRNFSVNAYDLSEYRRNLHKEIDRRSSMPWQSVPNNLW